MSSNKLPLSFYQQQDVVSVAKQLIGKVLCTRIGDHPLTSGIITETEAYCGRGDKACHANNGTRTQRTETMYQAGGIAYIYLCYGIHHLFNVVTNRAEKADAVLIRAIQPLDGKEEMLRRRNAKNITPALTAGPGRLTQALGITTAFDGVNLNKNTIWIEDRGSFFSDEELKATQRVGVAYAGEDAELPWRFYPSETKWVSKK
jgi:DNA-3-methyladenine glycosylase